MPDTQWPRFMVFQQEAESSPFVHNGTVHAPDIEMALQNARDVFARRPEAAAMWVVPAEVIYTQTREELQNPTVIASVAERSEAISPTDSKPYYVFAKFNQPDQCRHVGEVIATHPQAATQAAIENHDDLDPLWWWVFPKDAVMATRPQDAGPMFAPARNKTFKDQAEYPVVTMMREIRSKGKLD